MQKTKKMTERFMSYPYGIGAVYISRIFTQRNFPYIDDRLKLISLLNDDKSGERFFLEMAEMGSSAVFKVYRKFVIQIGSNAT